MRELCRRLVCATLAAGLGLAPARVEAAPPADGEPSTSEADASEADPLRPHDAPAPVEIVAPPDVELIPPEPEPEPEPEPVAEDLDEDLDEDLETDADTEDGFDDGYDPARDSPEAATARRWFAAGVAATVTGAVLLGGGIALSLTTPCNPNAGNNCFPGARDRAAVTMGVPGGVLLAGGIAMTVFGALQKKRLKASLALAPGHLGVFFSGRF